MTYSDQYGEFFGRKTETGILILHIDDGEPATRLDASVYPVGASLSTLYEHPEGIILTPDDASRLGIEIEA